MTYTSNIADEREYDPETECKIIVNYEIYTFTASCSECGETVTVAHDPDDCPGCGRTVIGVEDNG